VGERHVHTVEVGGSKPPPPTTRFGIKLSGQDTTASELRAFWRVADEGGFDHLWDFDHLQSIGEGGPDRPVFEGWALQAAMAVATERVRIGCLVTGNTYRHPALLAKLAVTVDHLSGGRLEFGIGAAWAEIEHETLGFEGLDHRVGRLSESLRIIRSLWTEERATFEGRYYTVREAIANPKPLQQPHPPIWIGASGAQTLRLAARHADVWNASGGSPEHVRELSARLDEACAVIGRDPATIRRSVQMRWDGRDRAQLLEVAGGLIEVGITDLIVYAAGDALRTASAAAEALPDLRRL
jgi:F420-dependent oxidoreductase-like protein